MGFNFGNAYATGVSGAASGLSAGPYGALAGGVAGLLLGGFSGSNSSSANSMSMEDMYNLEMYNTMKDLYFLDQQNKYNQSNMRLQYDLQNALNRQQFEDNKYFIENAYQMTTEDMKKAGINPVLAAGSSNVGSVGAGSASALGASASRTAGMSPSELLSAQANSAQAKVAKSQLGINAANAISDIGLKSANSAKARADAATAESQTRLNDMNTRYQMEKIVEQQITNSNLDDKQKAELQQLLAKAKYDNLMADIEQELLPYKKNLYSAESYNQYQQGNDAGSHVGVNRSESGRIDEVTRGLAIDNDFNENHPGIYASGKVLNNLSSAIGLLGGFGVAGLLRGNKMTGTNPNVKSVIYTPPSGMKYDTGRKW